MKLPTRFSSTPHNAATGIFYAQYAWVDTLAIAVFCFALPLGMRKALWQLGAYPPYTTIFLYATDIVMIALLAWWMFSERARIRQRLREMLRDGNLLLPVLAFFAFLGIGVWSALRSETPPLGFATLARLLLFATFAFFLSARKPRALRTLHFAPALFISGVFQALLGVYQYIAQRSFGLALLGEQALGQNIAGVAKIDAPGEKLVRAYGTLPHPNILAAFLLLAIFSSGSAYLNLGKEKRGGIKNIAWLIGIALMLVALLFTFSRSGWLAFGMGAAVFAIWLFAHRRALLPDHTQRLAALGIILASATLFSVLYFHDTIRSRTDIPVLRDQAVQERLHGIFWAAQMIDAHRYLGVGPGQFTPSIARYAGELPEPWMYQPVHNAYALVAAEFGVFGLAIFLIFLWALGRLLFVRNRTVRVPYSATAAAAAAAVFIAVLVLGLFDHYFFTFEQGMGVFWISMALALGMYWRGE